MKTIDIIYAIASIGLVTGVILKINDFKMASLIMLTAFFIGISAAIIHYVFLQKKIKNLEED